MIEKLQIKNFGANERIDIDCNQPITCIVGKSFLGKSWILRALRWVARNKPTGDSYIHWDADKSSVRLTVDKTKITRTRSKSINTYKLGKKVFEAFGTDVPKKITQILNLSDINFQGVNTLGQHEPPFWFSLTAGEVSRELNAIVNLDIIDKTQATIAAQLRKARSTIEVVQSRVDNLSEQKEKLQWVKRINTDLEQVESLQIDYLGKARICDIRRETLKLGENYTQACKIASNQASVGGIAMSAGDLSLKISADVQTLSDLIKSAKTYKARKKAKPPSLARVKKAKEYTDDIKEQIYELELRIESLADRKECRCQAEVELKQSKMKFNKAVGDKCPLCGAPMKKL